MKYAQFAFSCLEVINMGLSAQAAEGTLFHATELVSTKDDIECSKIDAALLPQPLY